MITVSSDDAVMLFGSTAREEATVESDLDILVLREPAQASAPPLPITFLLRDPQWLHHISRRGDLFAMHLHREGRILQDPHGVFGTFKSSPLKLRLRGQLDSVTLASSVLHARDMIPTSQSTLSVARHLLRTAVFLTCAQRGYPTFSHAEAARRLHSPDVEFLLRRAPTPGMLPAIVEQIEHMVGRARFPCRSLLELTAFSSSRRFALQMIADEATISYDPGQPELQAPVTLAA